MRHRCVSCIRNETAAESLKRLPTHTRRFLNACGAASEFRNVKALLPHNLAKSPPTPACVEKSACTGTCAPASTAAGILCLYKASATLCSHDLNKTSAFCARPMSIMVHCPAAAQRMRNGTHDAPLHAVYCACQQWSRHDKLGHTAVGMEATLAARLQIGGLSITCAAPSILVPLYTVRCMRCMLV